MPRNTPATSYSRHQPIEGAMTSGHLRRAARTIGDSSPSIASSLHEREQDTLRSVVEGVVVHGVTPGCAVRVDPGWWEVFGDTVGGEPDLPVALVDQAMMVWADEHAVVVAGRSALYTSPSPRDGLLSR